MTRTVLQFPWFGVLASAGFALLLVYGLLSNFKTTIGAIAFFVLAVLAVNLIPDF